MPIYLVTYDLISPARDNEAMHNFLNTLGEALQVQKSATFLSTDLTEQELHTHITYNADSSDEWIITKLEKDFTGSSNKDDLLNRFLKSQQFI
ncbi:hypothetical protein GJU41_12515 [Bacillus idriensis]|uniref:Uncharacterized protein n=1 Tax=Metabacillus idriensis TaxID=324768 RepID=A0A6I2M9J6_9BACI|nr:hypothetical protein [Metabacillus idriensis]MRX54798.1 hypothetical protein [Metabacillus idriensis]